MTKIMRYNAYSNQWYSGNGAPYSVMDLRGAAQTSTTTWIICGGMNENQQVTNRTFLLTYDPITGGVKNNSNNNSIYIYNREIISTIPFKNAILYDLTGKFVENINSDTPIISSEKKGVFILRVTLNDNQIKNFKIVIQ